jgi:hypothetical protein
MKERPIKSPEASKQKTTVLGPLAANITRVGKKVRAATLLRTNQKDQDVIKCLDVLSLAPITVANYIISLDKPESNPVKSSNQNLPSSRRVLHSQDVKFPVPEIATYGHCSVLMTRTKVKGVVAEKVKLYEGGNKTSRDHPRVTVEGRKVYLYHLVAMNAGTTEGRKELCITELQKVSQDKKDPGALSILHG